LAAIVVAAAPAESTGQAPGYYGPGPGWG
jgi:hypothetical protein